MLPLQELIQNLPQKEIEVAKRFLKFFSEDKKQDTLLTKLFNYLLSHKKPLTEADCCNFIYGTQRKMETYRKLQYRLRTKVFDSLCTELNEEKKEMMDEVDLAAFRVRKKSIQARILFYLNPKLDSARELLDEVITECKKFEFYNVLTESIEIKRVRYIFKEGKKAYDKSIAESHYYKECANWVIKANDYYYQLIFIADKNEKRNNNADVFLNNTIKELQVLTQKTRSNMIKYYLKFFELYQFMKNEEYVSARKVCEEIIDVITNSPAVTRKKRLGIALDNLSRCELLAGDFEKAEMHAKAARENFVAGSHDYSMTQEQEFYALFFNKKYKEAEKIIIEIVNEGAQKELGEFLLNKYIFYYAYTLFSMGKYQNALDALPKKWHESKDYIEWEIALRILRLKTNIELENIEEASKQTEALRKYFEYLCEKGTAISNRSKTILELLRLAAKKDFQFKKLTGDADEFLFKLKSNEESYAWKYSTPELIPFHKWFEEKISK